MKIKLLNHLNVKILPETRVKMHNELVPVSFPLTRQEIIWNHKYMYYTRVRINYFKRFCTFIMCKIWKRLSSYEGYNFSCISVCRRRDVGPHLELKHVAVNKLIKTSAVCCLFHTYTCVLLTPRGVSHLKSI